MQLGAAGRCHVSPPFVCDSTDPHCHDCNRGRVGAFHLAEKRDRQRRMGESVLGAVGGLLPSGAGESAKEI